MSAIQKGKYRHYKGNLYEVIDTACNSENLEDMVVYKALYGDFMINVSIKELPARRLAVIEHYGDPKKSR